MIETRLLILGLMVFTIITSVCFADNGFPLRNGIFYEQLDDQHMADWRYDDAAGKQKISGRIEIRLETVEGPPASISQDVQLPPGEYLFSVELAVAGGSKAVVTLGEQHLEILPTEGFQKLELPFAGAADGPTTIQIASVQPGAIAVQKARIDVVKLKSGPVPLTDGKAIGRIVLPADPVPAERFAAWELQLFIQRITGTTPGLEGRDETTAGRAIYVGRSAKIDTTALGEEGYVVASDADSITLAGYDPRGTLYAVYDFLWAQGCGWYMPGIAGEVVPKRETLDLPDGLRKESPDWNVRGLMIYMSRFDANGKHSYISQDDVREWAARNRINAYWMGGTNTAYFPEHLGFSYTQRVGHTWGSFLRDDRPEWFPLVNGVRTKMNPNGLPNMQCTSNPEFRAYVIEQILQYFKEHPRETIYALSPEDEPASWCECENCRAQDPDGGKQPWILKSNCIPTISMADRATHFVNEVADKVAETYPGKQMELYSYGSYRNGPTTVRVSPNIQIMYCYWPGVPLGGSAFDRSLPGVMRVFTELDSWRKAGAQHFGLYSYGNYTNPGAPFFGFKHVAERMKWIHDEFGCRYHMGETSNNVTTSALAYLILARAMWNKDVDYKKEIEHGSLALYGSAGETMHTYYTLMHNALEDWRPKWKSVEPNDPENGKTDPAALPRWAGDQRLEGSSLGYYWANDLIEYDASTMLRGKMLLKKAKSLAGNDAMLIRRIEIAEFAHEFMTYLIAKKANDPKSQQLAQASLEEAKSLWGKYPETLVQIGSPEQFGFVRVEPIENAVYALPIEWKFHIDPRDIGKSMGWHRTTPDQDWIDIRTDRDWTAQGHDHHGIAWYAVTLEIPADVHGKFEGARPKLHFGAIDGYADIYLDGKPIGRQGENPNTAWDKAFVIDLPEGFDPAVKHTLVVRVEKKDFAAGIWKPVAIVIPPSN